MFLLFTLVACEKGADFSINKISYEVWDTHNNHPRDYAVDTLITTEADITEIRLEMQTAHGNAIRFHIETPTQKSDYVKNGIITCGISGLGMVKDENGYKEIYELDINKIHTQGCSYYDLENPGDTFTLKASIDNIMSKDLVIIYK